MKHKTWFRLVMKAIGVLLICLSLPDLMRAGVQLASTLLSDPGSGPWPPGGWWWWLGAWGVGPALQLALGLYLVLGGKWIVDTVIPSNRPYCPECGYDVSKATASDCPECGSQLPAELRTAQPAEGASDTTDP